ncbi:MAG: SLC13 family permease, partial [Bacteroidetes bacterium]|nr:SLC13 family permease [Bacteroidota bacterium]
MITLEIVILFSVIALIIVSLYMDYFRPAGTFLMGIVILSIFGILTPKELLVAFSNEQIAVILLLLILAGVFNKSGAIDLLFRRIFKSVKTYPGFMSRMMFGVAG